MHTIQLYPKTEPQAVESTEPLSVDHDCTRCPMHQRARSVCLSAEGEPGGVLLVGEYPGKAEDTIGRPFTGGGGDFVRKEVAKHWKGPIAFDYAVRCYPPKDGPKPAYVEACRGYLAKTIQDAQPSRIISFGSVAQRGLLGRSVAPLSARGTYSFLRAGTLLDYTVPVFSCLPPNMAMGNRFVRAWLAEDLEWALTSNPAVPAFRTMQANVVDTPDDVRLALEDLRQACADFDVETAGRMWCPSFRMLCLSLCRVDRDTPYLWDHKALSNPEMLKPLLDYFADPTAAKGGQNVKYDLQAIASAYGVFPQGVTFDTRLVRKLLDAEADAHLDKMADLIGMGGHKQEMERQKEAAVSRVADALKAEAKAEKKGKQVRYDLVTTGSSDPEADEDPVLEEYIRNNVSDSDSWSFALVDKDLLYRYNARDVVTTVRLHRKFDADLRARPDVHRIWERTVRDMGNVAARIEANGVPIDLDSLRACDARFAIMEQEAQAELRGYADINWNSPVQVADFLFNRLKLMPPKTTATGKMSTDASVLESLEGKHSCVGALLKLRQVSKLRGTYTVGLQDHIRADGRLHGSLDVVGAASGRTSFSDPNLQNIPVRTELGRAIRNCFIAPPGWVFVQADYSQIELRVAAMLSGDPLMIDLFKSGVDFHQATAEMVCETAWHITKDKVTKEHRSAAKTVNFGCLYGQGAGALAKKIGTSKAQAARIQETILGRFHRLNAWCQEQLAYARKTGEVWTWWDGQRARRRPLFRVLDQNDVTRSVAEHGSWNTPVQGTANEFCVASMIAVDQWLRDDAVPAMIVLPIHDSIMLQVRQDAVPEVCAVLPEIMTQWNSMGVPIKVDVEKGTRWGSFEKVAPAA